MIVKFDQLNNISLITKKKVINHSEIYLTNLNNLNYVIDVETLNLASEAVVVLRANQNDIKIENYFNSFFENINIIYKYFYENNEVIIIDVFLL